MRVFVGFVSLALVVVPAAKSAPQQQGNGATEPPSWAYPVSPPEDRSVPSDSSLYHVPGSDKSLTRAQILDSFNVPDWHPDGHPPMPDIVEHGKKPGVRGCGYCHLPNALGRPENAGVAGLPAAYIEQQVLDFKSGARRSSEPKMGPPNNMILVAENVTEGDLKVAAQYFASLQLKPWIRVVETNTVPKTKVEGSMMVAIEGGGTEPIGQRIIETPENLERTEMRDDSSGFIAYVPVGSIKKGEALVTTGGEKTIQCGVCHGPDLHGLGPIPRLAGRSPSYLFRQLYDLQHGSRRGAWSALMKTPLAHLSEDDLRNIAAYLASLKP